MSFHEIEEEEELRGTYKLVVSAKAAKNGHLCRGDG